MVHFKRFAFKDFFIKKIKKVIALVFLAHSPLVSMELKLEEYTQEIENNIRSNLEKENIFPALNKENEKKTRKSLDQDIIYLSAFIKALDQKIETLDQEIETTHKKENLPPNEAVKLTEINEQRTPFSFLPNEVVIEIFKWLPPQDLKKIREISHLFGEVATFVLNNQCPLLATQICNENDLESYLKIGTLPRIQRVYLPSIPKETQLEELIKKGLSLTISAPTGLDKISVAEKLLRYPNCSLNFLVLLKSSSNFFTGLIHSIHDSWTLEDLKKLWNQLANNPEARSKITKSMEKYQHDVDINYLEIILSTYPFLSGFTIRNINNDYKFNKFLDFILNNKVLSLSLSGNKSCNELTSEQKIKIFSTLKEMNSLRNLHLHWCDINDQEAISIGSSLLTSLQYLNLHWNNIQEKGAQAIAAALCRNSSLQHLNLSRNNIGSEGARAIATALCINSTLTYLDLSNNNIRLEGLEALAVALKTNTTLTHLNLSWDVFNIKEQKVYSTIQKLIKRNQILHTLPSYLRSSFEKLLGIKELPKLLTY